MSQQLFAETTGDKTCSCLASGEALTAKRVRGHEPPSGETPGRCQRKTQRRTSHKIVSHKQYTETAKRNGMGCTPRTSSGQSAAMALSCRYTVDNHAKVPLQAPPHDRFANRFWCRYPPDRFHCRGLFFCPSNGARTLFEPRRAGLKTVVYGLQFIALYNMRWALQAAPPGRESISQLWNLKLHNMRSPRGLPRLR